MSAYQGQMEMMQNEMASIRKILSHQVSGLMWQEVERREPTRAFLVTQLKKMGLTDQVADQLACFVPDGLQEFEAWQTVVEMLQGQINTTNNEILSRGGIFSLIGPTGVGKTTTVAKLAAKFAQKHGADQVGLVTTDTFRIGAHEQLATFGKIIGCPVKVAKNAEDLANVLFQLRNRKLILIDTAGMSQRDIRLCEQLTTLMKNSRVKIKSYLVLSATVQYNVLQETVTHFKRMPLAGCIFTKIDECLSLGEIISIAIQNGLPIGYITNGQRVPEDIDVADGARIIEQAEQMLRQTEQNDEHQWNLEPNTQAVGMYD
jgi:flagellar biosynthesis protein FlhF